MSQVFKLVLSRAVHLMHACICLITSAIRLQVVNSDMPRLGSHLGRWHSLAASAALSGNAIDVFGIPDSGPSCSLSAEPSIFQGRYTLDKSNRTLPTLFRDPSLPKNCQSPEEKTTSGFQRERGAKRMSTWLRVKNGYPKFNLGKWEYELKSQRSPGLVLTHSHINLSNKEHTRTAPSRSASR